jgi:hypothetical protein
MQSVFHLAPPGLNRHRVDGTTVSVFSRLDWQPGLAYLGQGVGHNGHRELVRPNTVAWMLNAKIVNGMAEESW